METMAEKIAKKKKGETPAASAPVKKEMEPMEKTQETKAPEAEPSVKMEAKNLSGWFGEKQALFGVNMRILQKEVTAIIGPSGCGKSTLIRCFNRMHETVPGARHEGEILLESRSIYGPGGPCGCTPPCRNGFPKAHALSHTFDL